MERLPFDANDIISGATPLGVASATTPRTATSSISPDTDVDIYSISVTAGQTVDFDIDTTLNGPGGLGSFLRILDASGNELAFNNDGRAPGESIIGYDAYVRYTFPTAGNYYVGVSNNTNTLYNAITGANHTAGGANSTGSYTITATGLPIDGDDTIAEANGANNFGSITAADDVGTGSIETDIDVDLYQFSVGAGQSVDFDIDTTLNGPGGLGSFLRVFNSAGQELAFNDDGVGVDENVLGYDSFVRFTFASAGTYYVGVSNNTNTLYNINTGLNDSAGGPNSIGTYTLRVRTTPVDPTDVDDQISEATNLFAISTTPVSPTGTTAITPASDVDMYKFTVTAGQIVDFDIDTTLNGTGGLGTFLRLFNSTGTELAFNNDAAAPGEGTVGFDAYLRYTFATAGTYYLGVSNSNNTLYNATTGTGDVSNNLNATGTYTLTITGIAIDLDDQISEATNLGNVTATANAIPGTLSPDIDVHMYKFGVNAGQIVDFDIDTTTNGAPGLETFIRIFNASGTEIAFNDDGIAPGEATSSFDGYLRYTFPTTGTYYIGVSNNNNTLYNATTGNGDNPGGTNSTGDYTLTINTAPTPPIDTDDSIAESVDLGTITPTPVSSAGSAAITPDVDVDMYRFTVTAGQTVDFDIDTALNGAGGLGSFIRLFNASGTELAFNNDARAPGENAIGFDAYLRFTFTSAGTYYMGVSNATNTLYNATTGDSDVSGGANSTGAYTLTITGLPVDTDDTLVEATPLGAISATPIVRPDNIVTDIDVDLVQFTVATGDTVDFDIDTTLNGVGGLGSFIRLFNSSGTEIAFNDDAAAPGESTVGFDSYLRYAFSAGGTYYLGVSNNTNKLYNVSTGLNDTAGGQNSIGAYQLNISLVSTGAQDLNDQISEAIPLGTPNNTPIVVSSSIAPDTDVNMYQVTVAANQTVQFDIDTSTNGPGGLGSYLRLFDSTGTQLAFNNDGTAPGETVLGFDAYLSFTFTNAGTYYLGVSNANNVTYSPATGAGDTAGGTNSIGSYQLIVTSPATGTPTLALSATLTSIGEPNTTTTVTVTRSNVSIATALTVNLVSNDTTEATVPLTVTIPANQFTATFIVTAVDDALVDGTQTATITASATGMSNGTIAIQVADNESPSTLALSLVASSISEFGGTTTGTVTRTSANISTPLVVTLSSNDTTEATVPTTVTIPANQVSTTFTVTGVDDSIVDGTQNVTISATATGFTGTTTNLQVTDNEAAATTLALSSILSTISESGGTTTGTVTRTSANITQPLTVTLSSNDTTEATVPTTVTIPANQTSITFTITGVDDVIVDGTQSVTITATATGATSATLPIQVTDNDVVATTLALSSVLSTISESGGTTTGTVTRTSANITQPLTVTLSSSDTTEATVPATVTIPANQTSITFTITAVDDAIIDGTQSVTISATATGATGATLGIQVTDNDVVPALSISTVASSISELNGTTTGTVTRTNTNIGSPLVVTLTSNDTTEATVPATVTIPANQLSVTFTITAVDDVIVDGTQSVNISAAASGYTGANVGLQVTDNDAAQTLSLTALATSISEFNGATTGTVTRNTANVSSPLVVNLSSSDTSEATVPATVTIPANQASVTFTILGIDDAIVDGAQPVTITATASGLTTATLGMTVNDNDSLWQNPTDPLDVNNDGKISAFDVIPILNFLNQFGIQPVPSTGSPPPYYDVNSDNMITSFDAIPIINYLNLHPAPVGPEFVPFAASAGEATSAENSAGEQSAANAQANAADVFYAELATQHEKQLRSAQQERGE